MSDERDDPEPLDMTDADGHPIPPGEDFETEIVVWRIESTCHAYTDSCLIRDYRRACDYAEARLCVAMENIEAGQEGTVKVSLIKVRPGDYYKAMEDADA